MKHQKDNIEKIFGSESNIPVDLILGYIDNTLTKPELHKIESQLINDPFLTEAIEGLRSISEEERTLFIYKLLGKEPRKKLNIEIHPMVWKIAAVTIVAISSIYFISTIDFTSTSESLAQHEVATEEETPQDEPRISKPTRNSDLKFEETQQSEHDSIINVDLANIVAEANSTPGEAVAEETNAIKTLKKEAKATTLQETEEMEINAPAPALNGEDMNTGSMSRSANSADMENDSFAQKTAKKAVATRSNDQIATSMIQTLKRKGIVEASHLASDDQSDLSKKEASALASYDEGLDAYNRGNYPASAKRFEDAYKQNKSLPEVRYYLSTSYLYGSNNISKAKKVFKEENSGKYTDEKQWVKALIELGDGKSKNAKEILEKISKSGSKFKSDAEKLLLEIE